MLSSVYRYKHKYILANRVSAFNYWSIIDSDMKGYLYFNQFCDLLEACAFNRPMNLSELESECESTLVFLPNEFDKSTVQDELNIFRFRLFENLFLEQCAIYEDA